jgi:thymidine kinase
MITLVCGPMFAGKTNFLIDLYNKGPSLALKPLVDTRYFNNAIVSHSGKHVKATTVARLAQVERPEAPTLAVLIDEGQFFEDLVPQCIKFSQEWKLRVYVAALNGTYDQKPWPVISALLPYCDDVIFITATCDTCGRPGAAFTRRRDPAPKNAATIDIGGHEKYRVLHQRCFHEL